MAMLPFCGYNMGNYFKHWLAMGKKMTKAPKIFHVNWFRTDEQGKFMWPGFGENLRVLEWIMDRCRQTAGAQKTAIGFVPRPQDIDLSGIEIPAETMTKLLAIDPQAWEAEAQDVEKFFADFGKDMPEEMRTELKGLKERLQQKTIR
jgi:phosphoenolpyruvate carboxykinase (GTP)